MTFTGAPEDLDRLAGAPFGVTAPDALRPVAEALVVEMGGEPVWVPEEARALYHAALTHGANHLVTLVNQTHRPAARRRRRGPGPDARPAARRRARQRAAPRRRRAHRSGRRAATPAPSPRTCGCSPRPSPEALRAYVALARATADRALAAGLLTSTDAEALLDVLATTPNERAAS